MAELLVIGARRGLSSASLADPIRTRDSPIFALCDSILWRCRRCLARWPRPRGGARRTPPDDHTRPRPHAHQQISPLGHFSKNHSRMSMSGLAATLSLSFGARCRSDARGQSLLEARLPRARPLEVCRAVSLGRSLVRKFWLYGLDNGLDVGDAMSAAAVSQREASASAERRASSEHQQPPRRHRELCRCSFRVPMNKVQSARERRAPRGGCQGRFDGQAWRMVAREAFGGHSARRHSARDCFCPPTRPRDGGILGK